MVTDEGGDGCELKNIAAYPRCQRLGYGGQMAAHLLAHDRGAYRAMRAGTGESPRTLVFYRSCGFVDSHRVKNFFLDNYDHLIEEDGIILRDMVYLRTNF